MCETKPPHKQYVRREAAEGDADRSPQVARKTPPRIWSLAQDATVRRHDLAADFHHAPPLFTFEYASSFVSERFEMFRKTKILAVIHRTIDHGRLSA